MSLGNGPPSSCMMLLGNPIAHAVIWSLSLYFEMHKPSMFRPVAWNFFLRFTVYGMYIYVSPWGEKRCFDQLHGKNKHTTYKLGWKARQTMWWMCTKVFSTHRDADCRLLLHTLLYLLALSMMVHRMGCPSFHVWHFMHFLLVPFIPGP